MTGHSTKCILTSVSIGNFGLRSDCSGTEEKINTFYRACLTCNGFLTDHAWSKKKMYDLCVLCFGTDCGLIAPVQFSGKMLKIAS